VPRSGKRTAPFSGQVGSVNTHPLRLVHANRVGGSPSQVERNSARKRTAIIDYHRNGPPAIWIGNRHLRPEWQGPVRGSIATGIEGLPARSSPSRNIVGRDDILSRAGSVRSGMREEPGEAPTMRLCRRRNQQCCGQSNDAWQRAHCRFRSYEQLVSAANARTPGTMVVVTTEGMKSTNMRLSCRKDGTSATSIDR